MFDSPTLSLFEATSKGSVSCVTVEKGHESRNADASIMNEGWLKELTERKGTTKITLACHCVRTSFLTLSLSFSHHLYPLSLTCSFSFSPLLNSFFSSITSGSVLSLFPLFIIFLCRYRASVFSLFIPFLFPLLLLLLLFLLRSYITPCILLSLLLFSNTVSSLSFWSLLLRDILHRLDCTFFELLSRWCVNQRAPL